MRSLLACTAVTALVACDLNRVPATQDPEPNPSTTAPAEAPASAPKEAADPRVSVPGTAIRLVPPPGYVALSGYDGFRNEDTGGILLIMNIERPYEEVRSATETNLARAGLRPDRLEELAQGELPGRMMLTTQERPEGAASTWEWMFGDEDNTVVIAGTCRQMPCEEELAQIESALRSAVWDTNAPQELGMHLADTAGLIVFMADERSLRYSRDGTLASDVSFEVSLVPGAVDDVDRQHALGRFAGLHGFEAQQVESVVIDGLEGRAFMGANKDGLFYEVVLFDKAGIWYLSGSARQDSPAMRRDFVRIAKSFARGSAARFSAG